MKKLGEYHRKRSRTVTNEPFGGEAAPVAEGRASTLAGAYVVHLHDATRRHYDLRLEVGGVLASFAVPRGPSLDPDEKSLAVKTEDHPIEYLEFEDVIPDGQYGAGPMIAWDRGTVEYLEGPAEEEIERGKLDLRLRGMKLRGRYALVKLKKSAKGDEWLLFKKKDEHASKERKILDELPRSVFSGLTVEELEASGALADAWVREALRAGGARSSEASGDLLASPRSPLVSTDGGRPPRGSFVYDADLGGVRVLASRDGDVVTLRRWDASGAPESIEAFYPDVVRALRALPMTRIAIDGELVAFDANGHPSTQLLAGRPPRIASGDSHRAITTTPVVLVSSDLLVLGDVDLRAAPIEKRRALLAKMLPPIGFLRAAPPLEGALDRVLATCTALGLAGVVAKKKGSSYAPPWYYVSTDAPKARVTVDHAKARGLPRQDRVTVTNRGKKFWPDEGLTKGDLCDYYVSVAAAILPYLADRPVILVRYPDGITGKSFYQWNVPHGMPPWAVSYTHLRAQRPY